jgi:hypothetical protein
MTLVVSKMSPVAVAELIFSHTPSLWLLWIDSDFGSMADAMRSRHAQSAPSLDWRI